MDTLCHLTIGAFGYNSSNFIDNRAFFPNYCLNFLIIYDLYLTKEILWVFITIINQPKVQQAYGKASEKRKKTC